MPGNSVQGGGSRVARAVLLSLLYLLPIGPDLIHVLYFEIAKDMRVAANQFLGNVTGDFIEIERAALFGELTMENDLEEQVAQFFGHLVIVTSFDGIEQFIDFLNRVPAETP